MAAEHLRGLAATTSFGGIFGAGAGHCRIDWPALVLPFAPAIFRALVFNLVDCGGVKGKTNPGHL